MTVTEATPVSSVDWDKQESEAPSGALKLGVYAIAGAFVVVATAGAAFIGNEFADQASVVMVNGQVVARGGNAVVYAAGMGFIAAVIGLAVGIAAMHVLRPARSSIELIERVDTTDWSKDQICLLQASRQLELIGSDLRRYADRNSGHRGGGDHLMKSTIANQAEAIVDHLAQHDGPEWIRKAVDEVSEAVGRYDANRASDLAIYAGRALRALAELPCANDHKMNGGRATRAAPRPGA